MYKEEQPLIFIFITLSVIMNIFAFWMNINVFFQIFISFFGFSKNTLDYKMHDPKLRFLVLVPAHNEADVIDGIISNMNKMDYPKELYDFYILADNCTDNTAEIAEKAGAKVLTFFKENENDPTGKSIVLKKAFEALPDYAEKYDAVFFFDADNWADYAMFSEVNSQFLDASDNTEIIQCYLGSKNKKGLVAFFYYCSYTISNRFLQYSRQRLGINCGIGGTGFAVRTRYLKQRGGWSSESLTEDTELQIAATLEGKRILWNNHVRVYDEKPITWKASYRQRVRWAKGHWYIAIKNTSKVIKALFSRKIPVKEGISMLVQLYFPATYLLAIIYIIFTITTTLLSQQIYPSSTVDPYAYLIPNAYGILLFIYMIIVQFSVGELQDNKQKVNPLIWPFLLLSFVLNSLLASVAQIVGLFTYKNQHSWDKTEHFSHVSDVSLK